MANSQSICTSFLQDLLGAYHNFSSTNVARTVNTADTFKGALYVATANTTSTTTMCATVTAYATTVNTIAEVSGTDRKSTRLNSSHIPLSRMPSSA